jgi:hypothetical protein
MARPLSDLCRNAAAPLCRYAFVPQCLSAVTPTFVMKLSFLRHVFEIDY